MATYEYKCVNENCPEYNKPKTVNIPMAEYSEDKLPVCEKCSDRTARSYTSGMIRTFGDGVKH